MSIRASPSTCGNRQLRLPGNRRWGSVSMGPLSPTSGTDRHKPSKSRFRNAASRSRSAVHLLGAQFHGPSHTHNARNIQCSAAQSTFLAPAIQSDCSNALVDPRAARTGHRCLLARRTYVPRNSASRLVVPARQPAYVRRPAWHRCAAPRLALDTGRRFPPAAGSRRFRCWPASPSPETCRR